MTAGGAVAVAGACLRAANYALPLGSDAAPAAALGAGGIAGPAAGCRGSAFRTPGGAEWLRAVPVRERPYVRIGVMCDRGAGRHFGDIASRLSERWGVDPSDIRQPRQKILPLGPIDRTYSDRVLALGDAAGLVKPTTGGGIYYSLLSADLGAETLIEALPRNELQAANLAVYERRWRKRLGSELRWQLLLPRLAPRLGDGELAALFGSRGRSIMPIVRRTAAFNHHREFITALFKHPPARRLLLRAVVA